MPSPIQSRDSEARIRALTREVGTLREDLRRETKRRERSVAQVESPFYIHITVMDVLFHAKLDYHGDHVAMQIRQNEEAKSSLDAKIKELQYTNKKLTAELAAAHESQTIATERNRRALKSLREGLASVESAVAVRAQQGKALLSTAFECLTRLKQELFDQGGIGSNSGGFEVQVTVILAEAVQVLGQLEHLLLGATGGASDKAVLHGAVPALSLQSASYQLERVSFV